MRWNDVVPNPPNLSISRLVPVELSRALLLLAVLLCSDSRSTLPRGVVIVSEQRCSSSCVASDSDSTTPLQLTSMILERDVTRPDGCIMPEPVALHDGGGGLGMSVVPAMLGNARRGMLCLSADACESAEFWKGVDLVPDSRAGAKINGPEEVGSTASAGRTTEQDGLA